MPFNTEADCLFIDTHYPTHKPRPVIGIYGNYGDKGCELGDAYYKSIEAAGGAPVILPPCPDFNVILNQLERIDALVLSGGADVNPLYMGEDPVPALHGVNSERDRGELLMTRLAYDRNIPILGICRGIQVLAAALGGSVHQDLATAMPDVPLIKHSQDMPRGVASHRVKALPDSLIARLLGEDIFVNSFHHQAVNEPGDKLRVTARSADGVVEAVESTEEKSIIGVQWHPESFYLAHDKCMMPLFKWFIEQAESYRRAVDCHRQVLTLDSHVDTPMFFDQGVLFHTRDPKVRVDMHKLSDGHMDSVIMAAYLKQEGRSDSELQAATAKADSLLDQIQAMVEHTQGLQLAYTPKDLFRIKQSAKKSVMLGIENGYAIGKDLSNIAHFRNRGVVYMTLCHNGDNDICDSARNSRQEHGGLSEFGRNVVSEMNRVGMMIDLSHAAESTFYDVLQTSNVPVICSHSSSRACCDHPRNLTDDQLRELAAAGGVAQVTFYHGFLREDGEATIKDVVRHFMHMVDVAGIEHVGFGSDFDGDGGVPGLQSESDMLNLTRCLMAEGFNIGQLRRAWGGNLLRVMNQVQYRGTIKF